MAELRQCIRKCTGHLGDFFSLSVGPLVLAAMMSHNVWENTAGGCSCFAIRSVNHFK